MSVSIQTVVFCDEANCPREGEALGSGDASHLPAYQQIKEYGWKLKQGGKHICDECLKRTETKADKENNHG